LLKIASARTRNPTTLRQAILPGQRMGTLPATLKRFLRVAPTPPQSKEVDGILTHDVDFGILQP
jgi:hypothetical protein